MAKKKTTGGSHRPTNRPTNRPAAARPATSGRTTGPATGAGSKAGPKAATTAGPKTASTAGPKTVSTAGPKTVSTAGPKTTTTATSKPASSTAPRPAATPPRPRGGPTRAERLAAAEKERHRRALQTRAAVAGGVAVVLFVVGFLVVSNNRDRAKEAAGFESGSCQFDRKSDGDAGLGQNHVANPTYNVDPPAGGDHLSTPAAAGVYTAETTPPDGELVHSLEHGYIILWYRPDLPAADLTAIQDLVQRHARDVLLVPRASLGQPIAATAWHARLLCGGPDVASLERFVDQYANKGPEKVPH